jgi:hypothetical protein
MRHLTFFGWYWIAWFLAFLAPELYWLWSNPANTLSEEWWALTRENLGHPFDFAGWSPLHYFLGALLLAFAVWLFLHLTFGLLR